MVVHRHSHRTFPLLTGRACQSKVSLAGAMGSVEGSAPARGVWCGTISLPRWTESTGVLVSEKQNLDLKRISSRQPTINVGGICIKDG